LEALVLRRLYDWVMGLAARKDAVWALAAVAFIESSVFPVPPDVLLIPMVLAARASAWRYAAVCTIASVLGGMLGYAIGLFLFDTVGQPIVQFYGVEHQFADFSARYNEWGAWIVFFAGVTPFPYKVITIASGATQLDPVVFSVASVLARGLRFFLVAALLWWVGPPIRDFIERRLALVTTAFCVLLLGGFVVARYAL
jgi:membrane protein YqaA with SNARE-associated domain